MYKKQGFTLVELSIVIIIVGLIIATVSVGQSLIKQSEIRTVISEVNGHNTSLLTFKSIYNALPGDMMNAIVIKVALGEEEC
jgi:prepilin-type N-terminal cleavage/methylation domain-containing protein